MGASYDVRMEISSNDDAAASNKSHCVPQFIIGYSLIYRGDLELSNF